MAGMQVIGVSVTDEAIRAVARRATRPAVVEWAERVMRRHVRRERSLLVRVKDAQRLEAAMEADSLPVEARARIRAAFEAGDPVYTTSPQALSRFLSRAADTMDWIESLPESDRRIRRIQFLAWTDAEKLSEAWHASLARARKASRKIMEGARKIADLGEGSAFAAELTTQGALRAEGVAMGHCVGGYWGKVQSGETRIISIRDEDGQPHVTIELSRSPVVEFADGGSMRASHHPLPGVDTVVPTDEEWVAVQVRGKQNKAPVARYAVLVEEWLTKSGIAWIEYGQARRVDRAGGVRVYTAYGKSFRSADAASAWAEEMFGKEGGKGGFRARYVSSGLAAIHADASRWRVEAFLRAWLPRLTDEIARRTARNTPFIVAAREAGLSAVLANIRGSLEDSSILEAVYDAACSADPSEARREVSILVDVPGGRPLRLVVHALPLMPLTLLSSGFAPGMEDRVAAAMRPVLEAVARDILADPCAVHVIRGAAGHVPEADIRAGFLYCGLAQEFAAAAAAVEKALAAWLPEARLALKKARMSGRHPHEVLNASANLIAEGYGARLLRQAKSAARTDGLVLSAVERKSPAPMIRPGEEPVIKRYRLPR